MVLQPKEQTQEQISTTAQKIADEVFKVEEATFKAISKETAKANENSLKGVYETTNTTIELVQSEHIDTILYVYVNKELIGIATLREIVKMVGGGF